MRPVTLLLCCLLLAITLAGAGEPPAPASAPEPPLIEGVDLVLNMDFPAAYQHFEAVLRRWPDRPDGYLGKGLAVLTEHRGRRRLRANRDAIVQQLQQAAERAEQRFDARREIRDLFLQGMARGFESQVELAAGNLWSAFLAIREARSLLRIALSQDPGFVDPYLGLGFYDYLVSELPGLQRFVVSLLLDKGDKRRGLEEIRLAASRGRYVREYARAALMSIYAYGERQFGLALPLALALKERYPGNPDFYYAVATIYSELDRWDEALAIAQEIRERMERPTNGFRQERRP
ncbi:MAG: hypothetical protein HYV08_17535 [Deltaproteobacteria bacterium]|nr:hypothetical protein [Deltaproteobacteria bacterium]